MTLLVEALPGRRAHGDQRPPTEEAPPAPETEDELSQRSWLWGSVALLALLVLLTCLMSQQPDSSRGIPGMRLMPRLPEPVVYTLVGLFALGGVVVLAVLFRRELRFRRKKGPDEFHLYQDPPKFSFGMFVVLLLPLLIMIGLMAYLYWGGWLSTHEAQQDRHQAPLASVESPLRQTFEEKPATAAAGFAWTLFVLAALVGLGILGGGAWILFGERIERWWYGITFTDETRRALLEAVEISLDDLLREPDPRRAVIACYHRLELVLSQHGLPRAPWQTPLEYLRVALQRFHLPAPRLQGLTTLFELAKFSSHALGESEKHLAIAALREAKTALAEEHHVPAT
jgi:Domain of unknown function (DUF4129)